MADERTLYSTIQNQPRTLASLIGEGNLGAQSLLGSRTAGQVSQSVQDMTPYQKFNLEVFNMLKQAQQTGFGNTGKFREAELSATERQSQVGSEALPADIAGLQLSPTQIQEYRRQRQAPFKPGIEGAKTMRVSFQDQLDRFEKVLSYAKEFGKEFAKISPTPEIVEGYRQSIIAGNNPSIIPEEVRNQVLQKMTSDDWGQWAEANRKGQQDQLTLYQKEQQDLRKSQIFNQIVDKYQKSPLIVAADRTSSTLSLIPQLKKNPGSRENQLIAIYQFIQILDNYQSAVREGEIGLLSGSSSLIERAENAYKRLNEGRVVNPQVVLDIANGMESLVGAIQKSAQTKEKQFEAQANTVGVGDLWENYRGQFQSTFEHPEQGTSETKIYKGQTYIKIEGGWQLKTSTPSR